MRKRLSALLATTFVLGIFAVPGTASASCTYLVQDQGECTENYVCRAVDYVRQVDCVN